MATPGTSLSDWAYNALTGRITADQLQTIANQTAQDVIRAGGTTADAQAAAMEVTGYNASYSGGTAESYVSTSLLPTVGTATLGLVLVIVLGVILARKAGIL